MNLVTVRLWVDPYNERNQYKQTEFHSADLHAAKQQVDRAERGVILTPDPKRICSRIVYSKGF